MQLGKITVFLMHEYVKPQCMKALKTFFIYLIIIVVASFAGFIIFMVSTDYKPPETTGVYKGEDPEVLSDTGTYSLLIWNIGYCGLSAGMDFFYDGGEQVRPERNIVKRNLNGVKDALMDHKDKDFLLLQEVDKNAKRSYGINQYKALTKWFDGYTSTYGKNYDVPFVPVPIRAPMGHVNAGVMTISRPQPETSVRHDFPGEFPFPENLFMLDRCFLVNRYTLANSRELVLVNTHNSAYDGGVLKQKEMEHLKAFLQQEWENSNYIIVGGDWNQCPPEFTPDFDGNTMDNTNRTDIPPDYLPEWTWAYDNSVPTNRRVMKPYKKGASPTTVIDFYLLSPNIQLKEVNTINMDFKYSDHQPVELKVQLQGN